MAICIAQRACISCERCEPRIVVGWIHLVVEVEVDDACTKCWLYACKPCAESPIIGNELQKVRLV